MPFVGVGVEQRQVDTAGNGSLTPALPGGTLSTDSVIAVGVRHTNQANSGYSMTWSISSGWALMTQIIAVSPGATRSQRLHLAVWHARGLAAPTISWTGSGQDDNGRIGDIAICATYRPGSDSISALAADTDASTGTTDAYNFTSIEAAEWVVGVHAFSPNSAAVSFDNANGFELNHDSPGPDNLRPVLKFTQFQTPAGSTSYPAPTWGSPLRAAQMILGGFQPTPDLPSGAGIFVDGAVH